MIVCRTKEKFPYLYGKSFCFCGNATNASGLNTMSMSLGTFTNPLTLEITNSGSSQTFNIDNVSLTQDGITGVSYYTAQLVSAQDYYPFGTTLPGRTFQDDRFGGYRYAFNGQERDDEVAGAGNIMTAEFWEYDARLGRRWNVDPVVKPWQGTYLCFSGNPIWRIDPNGNDDYFNEFGTYLYSTATGSKIRILTSTGVHKISELNPQMFGLTISNIASYYGAIIGVSGPVGLEKNEGSIAHTSGINNMVNLSISPKTGSLSPKMDDFKNLKSTLFHEKLHQEENKLREPKNVYTYYKHYKVYSGQMDDKTFGELEDKEFQRGLVNSAVNYLIKSQKVNDGAMISQDINNLNLMLTKYNIQVDLNSEDLTNFNIIQDGKIYKGVVKDLKKPE